MTKLVKDTTFPWLLSNIIDTETSKTPDSLHEFYVVEKAGIRIGVIGLVEKCVLRPFHRCNVHLPEMDRDWIDTVASWPPNFKFKDMAQTGMELSQRLRDPSGEHKVDVIIALTHSRVPNVRHNQRPHFLSPTLSAYF